MNDVSALHEAAMAFCDEAYFARARGEDEVAVSALRKALENESKAARIFRDNFDAEPSRSVLFRSAASLAYECRDYRFAEKLIAEALIGEPPAEIAEELRDLLEEVNFDRHLELRNVQLTDNEVQLSMVGSEVGFGTVLVDAFIDRVKDIERVFQRTAERLLGQEFRERGAVSRSIREGYGVYLKAIRAQSFAFTIQIGRQLNLPGMDLSSEVVDEVVECFEIVTKGELQSLRERIPNEAYFLNFVNLAKRIAPDGDRIKMVGLTRSKGERQTRIAITKPQFEAGRQERQERLEEGENTIVEIQGRLLFANGKKPTGVIEVVSPEGQTYSVIVPQGMMDDIVRPLWDENVVVRGKTVGPKIRLQEIFKID